MEASCSPEIQIGFQTTNLSMVSFECGASSLTLRQEHRLRVFEDRVLRNIFGPKPDDVTGRWRKLHIKERRNLRSVSGIIIMIIASSERWNRHID
jgi:hypothetical protein